MDRGKLTSLVQWVNSVGVGPCVESLQQLREGYHLINIIKIINGDNGTQFCDVPVQRLRLICSFLEDFYGVSLQHHINHTKILQRADIEELAKITALLLCAAVQGPKVDVFVDMITKLDMVTQTHLKEIIEVIASRGGDCSTLRSNFSSVLYRKLNEDVCSSSPVEPCTPLVSCCKSSLMSASFSPVKALFDTPNMVTKMREKKVLYDKIRKLETTLANEKAVRSDREEEIKEKSAIVAEKEARIKELTQEVSNLRKQCTEIDNMRAAQNQLELSQAHVASLEKRLATFEELRAQNHQLDKQVERLVNANTDLEFKLRCFDALKSELSKHKEQQLQSQQKIQKYQAQNEQLWKELVLTRAACEENEMGLKQQKELTDEKTVRIKELEELQIANKDSGETMDIVPERRLTEVEAELQLLKETWVSPLTHQRAIDQLLVAKKEIEAIDLQLTESKEEIQRMNEEAWKLQQALDDARKLESCRLKERDLAQLQVATGREEILQLKDEIIMLKQALEDSKRVESHQLDKLNLAQLQVAESREEIKRLNEETQLLKVTLEDSKKVEACRLEELHSSQLQTIESRNEIQRLEEDIWKLQTSEEWLKAKVATLQDEIGRKTAQMDQQHHCMLQDVASTKKDVTHLQMQLEKEQRSHKEDVCSLTEEIKNKTEELGHLQARIRFENDSSQKELKILQEELDLTKRLLESRQNIVPPPRADVSMDSLDGQLDLADLIPGCRDSISSNTSTGSSKSHCKYTIEIHSRQSMCSNESLNTTQLSTTTCKLSSSQQSLASTQLRLSTNSNLSDSLNLSHLGPLSFSRASNLGSDNLPESVSQTIDELSTNQTKTQSLRASMRQSKINRRTTGRAGFCLIGACEEEPETFDWDRLSELQRRNTLCLPHLQTSYPVETQTRAPKEFSEDGLKQGVGKRSLEEESGTQKVHKRKSEDTEQPEGILPPKIKTSNSYAMPPPPPPDRTTKKSTTTNRSGTTAQKDVSTSSTSGSKSSQFQRAGVLMSSTKSNKSGNTSGGRKSVVKTPKKTENRRESIAFSVGFSPKPQFKRRSNRLSIIKKATNSPKVQAASPGITPRKSKRRSIAKWLGK